MRYVAIRPETRVIEPIEADTMEAALWQIGLKRGEVDHGMIRRARDNEPGIGIVVYQYSLYVDAAQQFYFAVGTHLYAGNALLYGFDEMGTSVDMPRIDMARSVAWFADAHAVEAAIRDGAVTRPQVAVNGEVIWRWPQRRPEGMPAA